MLLSIGGPRAINDVGVNVIRLRSAESRHRRYLRGNSERHHALLPVRAAENDGIPFPVCLEWHVAKIRHTSIQHPAPRAVEFRRVAIGAAVGVSK
jgi:transposase